MARPRNEFAQTLEAAEKRIAAIRAEAEKYRRGGKEWVGFPTAARHGIDKAALLEIYTGFDIPDVSLQRLDRDAILQWIADCKYLERNPHLLNHDWISDNYRQCPNCGRTLRAIPANFSRNVDGKNGLRSICRNCQSDYNHRHYVKRKQAKMRSKKVRS